jgi:hypothetical protein
MHNLLALLFLNLFDSAQVCGDGAGLGGDLYLEQGPDCADGFEHVCTPGVFEVGWPLGVCCSPDDACGFTLVGACPVGEKLTCGLVPVPQPEPWVCSPIGTLDAYVSDGDSCNLGELHVCTHGDTPPDPTVIACCDDANACRLAPADQSCNVGEWLACSHAE